MRLRLARTLLGGLITLLSLTACHSGAATLLTEIGKLGAPAIDEASGIAPSRRTEGIYWVLNDSGNQAVLYAIGSDGQLRGSLRLAGVKNNDWEDIASFTLDGRAYLVVADTGDNGGTRKDCQLHIVEEPAAETLQPSGETAAKVAWSVPVRFPGKPFDCESVAVDAATGHAYLLTKREHPATLYRILLQPAVEEVRLLRCGTVGTLPQPKGAQSALPFPRGRYGGQATGMSFSPDGRHAVILTYTHLAVFHRRENEAWEVTLGRAPERLVEHALVQAEAVCFDQDSRSILVTGEGQREAIFRWAWEER